MICYRDMTFCNYYKTCSNGKDCERAFTPGVQEAAERWMKNPPVCFFAEKPDCYESKTTK